MMLHVIIIIASYWISYHDAKAGYSPVSVRHNEKFVCHVFPYQALIHLISDDHMHEQVHTAKAVSLSIRSEALSMPLEIDRVALAHVSHCVEFHSRFPRRILSDDLYLPIPFCWLRFESRFEIAKTPPRSNCFNETKISKNLCCHYQIYYT